MSVAAVILAAGASVRLGEPKQLAELGGERLLDRAVRLAREAGCDPVLVVLGDRAEEIAARCDLTGCEIEVNAAWEEGMGSSLRLGIGCLRGRADEALVMACDQPAVTAAHLRALGGAGVVASEYAGRRGIPACFPSAEFVQLEQCVGNQGARQLLQGARAIKLNGGELDIDTPDDLAQARLRFG